MLIQVRTNEFNQYLLNTDVIKVIHDMNCTRHVEIELTDGERIICYGMIEDFIEYLSVPITSSFESAILIDCHLYIDEFCNDKGKGCEERLMLFHKLQNEISNLLDGQEETGVIYQRMNTIKENLETEVSKLKETNNV